MTTDRTDAEPTTIDELRREVANLTQRLATVEDELAIQRLIVAYGFAVDTDEADATAALFTDDCVFDVDGDWAMRGPGEVAAMVRGSMHQSLLPEVAHTIGPATVTVDGDDATAVGYSRIYRGSPEEGYRLFRVAFNRWDLRRVDGTWKIRTRVVRLVGSEEAQRVLRAGVPGAVGEALPPRP